MSNQKVLTILIPAYNGEKYIAGLLESFATYSRQGTEGQDFLDACELLVVNNRSEDRTLEIAKSFEDRLANLRVVTADTHVPSAEENVFRSFELARGEFTWVLGCDDIVRFEAFPELLQVARDGNYDVAIFNFMISDANGRVEAVSNFHMKNRVYEGDLLSLTQRMGFWWLIAGFSGQIVRTARVAKYNHQALVRLSSAIYSHVTAYLECFAGRPAAIVNVQNVIYRICENDISHWKRGAARLRVFDEYFWTLGYIRQIVYLESKGIVGRDYLLKMLETNRDFQFRPTLVIYDKFFHQMEIMSTTKDPRNRMTRAEFEELVCFFESRDLLSRPFFTAVRQIFDALEAGERVSHHDFEMARWRLRTYQSSYLLAPNFSGVQGDYEIYHVTGQYYAVHRLFRGALLERLRYLDDVEFAPIVFEAGSHKEVVHRICADGVGMNFDDLKPSAMQYCARPLHPGSQAWCSPSPAPPAAAAVDSTYGLTLSPTQAALHGAQAELRDTYRARGSLVTRAAAWVAAQHVKIVRWLLKRPQRVASRTPALS